MIALFAALLACGGQETASDNDPPTPGPGDSEQPFDTATEPTASALVTRCWGPSCPLGECGSLIDTDCSAYDGFDPRDAGALCAGARGSNQFCLETEEIEQGYLTTNSTVVDCSSVTAVQRTCNAGCGYNYAPDDCAVCNEDSSGCAL